jgi:hypothetical protein
MTIRDVNVRLRFAVAEHVDASPDDADVAGLRKEWTRALADEVLAKAYAGDDGRPPEPPLRRRLAAALAPDAIDDDALRHALAGDREALIGASVQAVAAAKSRLSNAEQQRLPNLRLVRSRAQPLVAERLEPFLARARKQLEAEAAARSDLDVIIAEKELREVAAERIHELTFTLAADDVIASAPPSQSEEDDRGGD